MKLIICVSDYWHHKQWYNLNPPEEIVNNKNNIEPLSYNIEVLKNSPRWSKGSFGSQNTNEHDIGDSCHHKCSVVLKRLKVDVDGVDFFYLLKELVQFTQFRQFLCNHPAMYGVQLLWLQIVPPRKEIIDFKWNRMLSLKIWEKIETDYLMSWLSTLGGGFSALGEEFSKCAQVAGKISQRQFRIGIQLGDPFLQSRCLLYYSISLIQIGRLRSAKKIIRSQYAFALPHEEYDGRLVKMCQGIWLRLQYEYGRRLKSKKEQEMELESTV